MGWIIGIVVVLVVLVAFAGPGKCDVCGLPIKKHRILGK